MNNPDRATACRMLRRLRERRGWSWADQARALHDVAERLGRGDIRAATTLLHDCIEITAATRGRVAAQRIGHARRELAPWRTEPFVTELDDHIYDAMVVS